MHVVSKHAYFLIHDMNFCSLSLHIKIKTSLEIHEKRHDIFIQIKLIIDI